MGTQAEIQLDHVSFGDGSDRIQATYFQGPEGGKMTRLGAEVLDSMEEAVFVGQTHYNMPDAARVVWVSGSLESYTEAIQLAALRILSSLSTFPPSRFRKRLCRVWICLKSLGSIGLYGVHHV